MPIKRTRSRCDTVRKMLVRSFKVADVDAIVLVALIILIYLPLGQTEGFNDSNMFLPIVLLHSTSGYWHNPVVCPSVRLSVCL